MASLYAFAGVSPILGRDVWIAPNASVIGAVTLGNEASVWFGAVLRGDGVAIVLGERSNVQDNAVVHITHHRPLEGTDSRGIVVGTRIGSDVTIGHGAVVHACTIGDRVLIGMGALVLDGAVIGNDVVVAAGTVVPPGMQVPSGVLVMGVPAKVRGPLRDEDRYWSEVGARNYVGFAKQFRDELKPID